MSNTSLEPVCKICGCTFDNPCHHPDYGTCWWHEESLCSHCGIKEISEDPLTNHPEIKNYKCHSCGQEEERTEDGMPQYCGNCDGIMDQQTSNK